MSHKFHDINGVLLVGIDIHGGQHWPTPIPAFMPFLEANAFHPFWMGGGQKITVQFNGVNTVVDGHTSSVLWPHAPIFPDFMNLWWWVDCAFGDQQCWLPRMSVHIEGEWSTVTTDPRPGLSTTLCCWEFTRLPSSFVMQPGTVETTPDQYDFVVGIFRAVVNSCVDLLFHWLSGGMELTTTRGGNPWTQGVGWSNVGDAISAMKNRKGWQKIVANSIGREFLSRILPLEWESGQWHAKSPSDLAEMWVSASGLDVGEVMLGLSPGNNEDAAQQAWDVAKNMLPPLNAAEGISQANAHHIWPFF